MRLTKRVIWYNVCYKGCSTVYKNGYYKGCDKGYILLGFYRAQGVKVRV